ncbi:unnamed protein product [Caretta caretta]
MWLWMKPQPLSHYVTCPLHFNYCHSCHHLRSSYVLLSEEEYFSHKKGSLKLDHHLNPQLVLVRTVQETSVPIYTR